MLQADSHCILQISGDTTLGDIEIVSFDIETTGLSPLTSKIVELSGVKFRLNDGNFSEFSTLVDPGCMIPPQVTAIHGITNKMVAGKPSIEEVIPKFFNWVGAENVVMAAHNAGFDVSFLKFAIARQQLPVPRHHVIDTLSLARRLVQAMPNYKLSTLVELLGLTYGEHHRALADSHHVRNLLQHISQNTSELKTWGQLEEQNCLMRFGEEEAEVAEPAGEIAAQLEAIKRAIETGTALSFMYRGMRLTKKHVSPLSITRNRQLFYLTANCHRVQAERTFRLDRISELALIEAPVGS
jgi:DNA polymerase III epsilon subunit family exonuclease